MKKLAALIAAGAVALTLVGSGAANANAQAPVRTAVPPTVTTTKCFEDSSCVITITRRTSKYGQVGRVRLSLCIPGGSCGVRPKLRLLGWAFVLPPVEHTKIGVK